MMAVNRSHKQYGFNLIEIMIALALGIIIITAAMSIYIATVSSSADVIKSSRLNYDMSSIMSLITNEVKRAGYWGGARIGVDTRTNPFTTGVANIQIPVSFCILYTYDYDGDGTLDGVADDKNEFFGFKLDNGVIKISAAKTVDPTGNCSATDRRWQTITEKNNVFINTLQFSFVPIVLPAFTPPIALTATTRCLNNTLGGPAFDTSCDTAATDGNISSGDQVAEKRVINIVLDGQANGDNTIKQTLSASIQVRNSRVFTQP
jgi:type IV pilus assembly protein PilW